MGYHMVHIVFYTRVIVGCVAFTLSLGIIVGCLDLVAVAWR